MLKQKNIRLLSLLLAAILFVSVLPLSVFAAGNVTNYADFLANFKQLEVYANEFGVQNNMDPGELVLNFVRTGVDRYQTGNWETLAGKEITAFTEYVESKDAAKGTTVMNLRNIVIRDFSLPNGNLVDFGHMFGTMNISYVASAIQSDDLAGWAGDLCDLFYYAKFSATVPGGNVEEMASYILENCFGVDADDAFGMDDFYGDMDGYYLITEYQKGNGSFSKLMEGYFNANLGDSARAAYFLNNRFGNVKTKEDVRSAIYNTYYTNIGVQVLEADRGLSDFAELRQACCYAFADYLFSKANGLLTDSESGGGEADLPEKGYYTVFSSTSSILAPGITQKINYATSADGKQMVYYVATVDVTRDDVTIMANYKDNDPSKGWGMQRVEDQVAALVKNHADVENFTAVVATNGDGFNTTTGKPGGLLVMEGREWNPVDGDGFFAILKDGSAMIGTQAEYEQYKNQIQEAIGAFGATLVKNGEIVVANGGTRASRTAIGIKADGSVVMMVLDGRQEPFSCGGTMAEIAVIMKEAGCVHAVNLDGGGSTTYMSKPEGSDTIKVVNRPSDGYARSVAASLVAVSTAKSSKEFDRAIIESDYEYLTVGTSLNLTAIGVNNIGSSAVIPDGSYWEVSDESVGTISEDGIFTALANGTVTVNLMVNGEIAGSKDLWVVVPDAVATPEAAMNVIYDVPSEITFVATYQGNPVAVKASDFYIGLQYSNAGKIDGFTLTAYEAAGYRSFIVGAQLLANPQVYTLLTVNLYRSDEAIFDFDNATAGNKTLAWLRDVSNATTTDGLTYEIIDSQAAMVFDYTFALDMTAIEIPKQLSDIVYMLPGADVGNASSAFNYLLQLAERVSILTEVKIVVRFDADVEVDISDLKVINDYFRLADATIDENNQLTMICNWIDQTQAIDPKTANPICILTGIKATPKDNAVWTDQQILITNSGEVSYDIYLRASSLYSFANKPENQQKYGLYPYSTDQTGYENGTESGAHFSGTYADFEDSFILNNKARQGWYTIDGEDYYFVDHAYLTGIQYIPSKKNPSQRLFYRFDENGVCLGTLTGVFAYGGGLCYASGGVMNTGWISDYDADGNIVNYYFDPSTGMAVDGVQVIDGYNYTFTNCVLTRGDLVTDSVGTRYRWVGKWLGSDGKYIWFEVDGNTYLTGAYNPYVLTGFRTAPRRDNSNLWEYHLFGDDGVLCGDYTGLWDYNGKTYYIKNGIRDGNAQLVEIDGYYYYVSGTTCVIVKNTTLWINKTNGIVPVGIYSFDENGRMINPPGQPDTPDTPETPNIPDTPEHNGIVEVDGNYYYYINGSLVTAGGYKLTDDEGEIFYIYVRSSTSTLAIGKYWPSDANGVFESKIYDFGNDGKYYPSKDSTEEDIVVPDPEEPVIPEVKNGIFEENGTLHYYVNGVMHRGGVVKLVDETGRTYYIYVRTSTATLATGNYWPLDNEYLAPGIYNFGTDGKYYPAMDIDPDVPVQPDEPEQGTTGIIEVDGKLYYYEDGKISAKFGVIQLMDEEGRIYYIYVRSSNKQVVTGKYWITITNDLLESKTYDFGIDGKYYPGV